MSGTTELADVIGRERECRLVRDWLAATGPQPSVLVLSGEAGIGKTTLWRYVVEAAMNAGYRVLTATAGSAPLQFAALGDVLSDEIDELRGAIPPPQLRALEVALLIRDPDGAPPDPRAIAFGVLSALRALGTARPIVIAIDDAQWLDTASGAALAFALRRLGEARIRIVLAHRDGDTSDLPLDIDRGFGRDRITRIGIGPLSIGALHALLHQSLGTSLRRTTLQRIHETSAGNPLYALELAKALERSGGASYDALPLPRSLADALRDRLAALPERTTEAIAVSALCADPTMSLLRDALQADDLEERLAPAVSAKVIEIVAERIRFAHPLLASAASAYLPPESQRRWRNVLARNVPTLEEQALHLALATDGSDEAAAAKLEDAARAAARRGAPSAAATMVEHALRLTPAGDPAARRRREVLAAGHCWTAGDYERGRAHLERALEGTTGNERAELLFKMASNPRRLDESRRLSEQALESGSSDPLLRARVFGWLALLSYADADLVTALRHAAEAVRAARSAGDEGVLEEALARMRFLQILHGEPAPLEDIAKAAERQLRERGIVQYGPAELYLLALLWSDEPDRATEFGERLDAIARESGSIARTTILNYLGQAAYRAGDWERSSRLVNEAIELASQYGVEHLEAEALAHRALLDVSLGRLDAARASTERGLALAVATAEPLGEIRHRAVLGFLELTRGDNAAAARELGAALEIVRRAELRNPAAHFTVVPSAIAAFVATGDLARAEAATRELEESAKRLGSPRARAVAARSRGLVLAANGDLAGALRALADAVEQHAQLPVPFERAITLLALGQVQRRAKQKAAARSTLSEALAVFERLPSPLWAEKARVEIARIGGRQRAPALTVAEERVAALVASGKTNKEVGAQLFLSVATVEATLTRVYAKLGVRSRAELAHLASSRASTHGSASKH